jgi:ABC-type branched-subunit amino acid transport system permease subunit
MKRLGLGLAAGAIAAAPWAIFAIGWRRSYMLQLASLLPVWFIAALSETVIAGFGGQVSVGQAGFMAVGAYTTGLLVGSLGWGWPAGIVAGLLAALVAAGIVGIPALRLRGPYFVMASLAFGGIAYVVAVNWVEVTGGPGGLRNLAPPDFRTIGLHPDVGVYYVLWIVALAVIAFVAWLRGTPLGRSLMAVREDELAAAAVGVHVVLVKSLSFMVSGALAGLAGALLALFIGSVTPDAFGINQSLLILTQVLIGGIDTIAGAIVGTVLLLVVGEVLRGFAEFQLLFYGAIMLAVVLFFPRGLVGALAARRSVGTAPASDGAHRATAT